jgi:hypothetical protein
VQVDHRPAPGVFSDWDSGGLHSELETLPCGQREPRQAEVILHGADDLLAAIELSIGVGMGL